MCGVAAILSKNASEKVMKILMSQNHRGTSSTGLSWVNDKEIHILKDILPPKDFNGRYSKEIKAIGTNIVMGHNRMPSKGMVTVENSHPFIGCDNKFSLMHNGTEHVYTEGEFLKAKGHQIIGQTDSEVLLHMFEELLESEGYNIVSALQKLNQVISVKQYGAILIQTKAGDIWGFGRSIVIVKDFNGTYVSSDIYGMAGLFYGKQKYVYEMGQDTLFNLTKNGIRFYGEYKVHRRVVKNGYSHEKKITSYYNSSVGNSILDFKNDDDLFGEIEKKEKEKKSEDELWGEKYV